MIINTKKKAAEEKAILLANRSPEQVTNDKAIEERLWRDSELDRTDKLATIKDYPLYYAQISYREKLRDYPNSEGFPNGTRPEVDITIKNALTKFQFISRFTTEERITIMGLAKTNSAISDWMELFKLTEEINLNDPKTKGGIEMLEQGGIIEVGRADEILNSF